MTKDGRHLTFLLVSLYEAGYGVHVVGSPFIFRELMLLRKSVPLPFVIGGKERECGISISDKSGFNHGEHNRAPGQVRDGATKGWPEERWSGTERVKENRGGKRFSLDYDYFSGLVERVEPPIALINTEVGEDLGKNESGENFNHGLHQYARIEAEQAGLRLAGQAGAVFSNPFTSGLAQDSENTSHTRCASGPVGARTAPEDRILQIGDRGMGSDGGSQLADSMEFLEDQSQAGLPLDNQKGPTIRTANDPSAARDSSSSALISIIRGQNASSPATSHSSLVTAPAALRMPYFMHPSVYHRGLHKRRSLSPALDVRRSTLASAAKQRRRFRIGFFGTHDREFYTKHYHFSGMNRFEILEVFLQKFGNRMRRLRGFPRDWDACEIAVSIDDRGGDQRGKSFLSQDHYFEALRECDFVLSPPGWCMPVSHNLIEAMFCGAVPITNAGAYMAEPITNGGTCLEFQDAEGLVSVIERALAMDEHEVERIRNSVRDYYVRFLEPSAFAEELSRSDGGCVFVNAEENSVPLVFPDKKFSRNI